MFSLLERMPLAKACTFLDYEAVRELAEIPHLQHVSPSLLDDYAETAE